MQTARRLVKGPDTAETSKKHFAHDLKEDLMGTKFFIIFVKYVVYDWG